MTDTAVRLLPGDQAPDFTLPDQDGEEVSLSSLLGIVLTPLTPQQRAALASDDQQPPAKPD